MESKDSEEQTFKNFIKNNVLVFFTYNQKVHKSLNHSRIYNSYWSILEVVQLILVNVVFSTTRQQLPKIFFTVLICITVLINFIIRIGNIYQYFQYVLYHSQLVYNPLNYCGTHRDSSNLFHSSEVSIKIIETCFQLIDTLCNMIDGYGQHTTLSEEACSTQYVMYYIWFSIMGLYFIFRVIGVHLAYEAYKFLRAKHNIEETKKKRKLRYLEMYKEKEQKKGEIQNQKYGDRKL